MRPRTLLLFAFVALLGAAAVVPALATASEVKLEVNQNCVDPNWPCWATPNSNQPALKVTITEGGKVEFVDHDPSRTASVVWTGGPTTPSCPGVPTTTTVSTGWGGTCSFATPGTYNFESSTLFKESGLYGTNDYTKYVVIVAGTPTDATTSASGETQTEAMLNGSINPEGNAAVEYHFEYEGPGVSGKQSTPTATLSAADFSSHLVSAQVTGLEPGMTYHFLLVATYGGKAVAGATTLMFKTNTVVAPTATTLAVEGVKETESTLKGTVNPGGEATEYFFEYGTDMNYGQKTAALSASGGNQTVSATLTKLTPDTEYHFRLVAKNNQGHAEGLDRSFKTMSPVAKEPPAKEPSPTPTSTGGNPTSTITPSQATSTTTQSTATQGEKAIKPLTRAQKLAMALKQCKKQPKKKRAKCVRHARKQYGPVRKKK